MAALRVAPVNMRLPAAPPAVELNPRMAVYHFSAKTVSRSAGRSSTAAAAYRAAERIVDERTGEIHDYTRKGGVVASEVILPGGGTMERAALWNKVEAHHKRGDATVAREFVVALPAELDPTQRQDLARSYARELADRWLRWPWTSTSTRQARTATSATTMPTSCSRLATPARQERWARRPWS